MSEQLRFVADAIDNVLTGQELNADELLAALDILNDMIGEQDDAESVQDSTPADNEDDAPAEQAVPADAGSDLGVVAAAEV